MADFPAHRTLNLTLDGSRQTLNIDHKDDFYILNPSTNSNVIEIYAGDNEVLIWELAPGDSWQVSELVAKLTNAFPGDVPLKVQGTNTESLLGFIA